MLTEFSVVIGSLEHEIVIVFHLGSDSENGETCFIYATRFIEPNSKPAQACPSLPKPTLG